jgi:hypothetical protein
LDREDATCLPISGGAIREIRRDTLITHGGI